MFSFSFLSVSGILDTAIVDRGRNIVSCGRDGTAKLWDCGTQTCLGTIENCGGNVNCCGLGTPPECVDLGNPEHSPCRYSKR